MLFQSANYLIQCYPGRCPGLYSFWAFSPSLLRANFVQGKKQNFRQNETAEIIFLIIATEWHGTTRTCREIYQKFHLTL
ncbi:hypothetical protein CJ232_02755 [Hoylesella timonensis]|uniref:Uncharacterized protein n=1 Tax=Hoylesella timonensis TaxID=386414 RepID=A0A2N6Q7P2_9BACT|nr:hypothetical protein CJ232_02755 [Hoylesella timonensis]